MLVGIPPVYHSGNRRSPHRGHDRRLAVPLDELLLDLLALALLLLLGPLLFGLGDGELLGLGLLGVEQNHRQLSQRLGGRIPDLLGVGPNHLGREVLLVEGDGLGRLAHLRPAAALAALTGSPALGADGHAQRQRPQMVGFGDLPHGSSSSTSRLTSSTHIRSTSSWACSKASWAACIPACAASARLRRSK